MAVARFGDGIGRGDGFILSKANELVRAKTKTDQVK